MFLYLERLKAYEDFPYLVRRGRDHVGWVSHRPLRESQCPLHVAHQLLRGSRGRRVAGAVMSFRLAMTQVTERWLRTLLLKREMRIAELEAELDEIKRSKATVQELQNALLRRQAE
jgi:hypothetical protein